MKQRARARFDATRSGKRRCGNGMCVLPVLCGRAIGRAKHASVRRGQGPERKFATWQRKHTRQPPHIMRRLPRPTTSQPGTTTRATIARRMSIRPRRMPSSAMRISPPRTRMRSRRAKLKSNSGATTSQKAGPCGPAFVLSETRQDRKTRRAPYFVFGFEAEARATLASRTRPEKA